MKKINFLNKISLIKNLESFDKGLIYTKDEGRNPLARYASFDYCYNYFQNFKDKKEIASKDNIQNSCLHLAFYLASWGMLRGSSFLLQKSIKYYEPLIKYISVQDNEFWKIDVESYSNNNIDKIIKSAKDIKEKLSGNGKNSVSDTLVTKIMLGVFGNVPAFDTYFKNGSGLGVFNKKALIEIKKFYDSDGYSKLISDEAKKIKTFEYYGGISNNHYTQAKIIDAIFFSEGNSFNNKE